MHSAHRHIWLLKHRAEPSNTGSSHCLYGQDWTRGVIQGYSAKPFESLQLPTVEDPDKAWFMSNVYCKAQPGWGQQQQHHTLTRKPHTNTKLTKEKKDRQRATGTLCMSVNHSANTQTLHSDPRYIYSVVLLKLLLKCPNSLKSFLSKSMMQLCLHLLATIWHCT